MRTYLLNSFPHVSHVTILLLVSSLLRIYIPPATQFAAEYIKVLGERKKEGISCFPATYSLSAPSYSRGLPHTANIAQFLSFFAPLNTHEKSGRSLQPFGKCFHKGRLATVDQVTLVSNHYY